MNRLQPKAFCASIFVLALLVVIGPARAQRVGAIEVLRTYFEQGVSYGFSDPFLRFTSPCVLDDWNNTLFWMDGSNEPLSHLADPAGSPPKTLFYAFKDLE